MKKLKYILIPLFMLFFLNMTHAQKGFRIINKAQKKYEAGKHKRALKLLNKADEMDYGFCGNAWLEAKRSINLIRSNIYMDQMAFQLARNCLDSIIMEFKDDNLDSMRIVSYQMEYGKDSLKQMFDLTFSNIIIDCDDDCYFSIPLSNGKSMKLKYNQYKDVDFIFEEDKTKRIQMWLNYFRKSNNYKLLLE